MAELPQDRYKVKIASIANPNDVVVFNVTPELNETRNVNYKNLDLIHMPGNIYAYGNSSTRTFSLVAKFISRTVEEAEKNSRHLQLMRSWTMPYFGKSGSPETYTAKETASQSREASNVKASRNLLGSPPDVLHLTAYADGTTLNQSPDVLDRVGNLYKIPIIITQLTNTYPSDITYIPLATGEPFPVIMNLDVQLTESHSPQEYSKFSLADFKAGNLSHF